MQPDLVVFFGIGIVSAVILLFIGIIISLSKGDNSKQSQLQTSSGIKQPSGQLKFLPGQFALTVVFSTMILSGLGLTTSILTSPAILSQPEPTQTMIVNTATVTDTPADTSTPRSLPPTWTPAPSETLPPTETLIPSETPLPSGTPFGISAAKPAKFSGKTGGGFALVLPEGKYLVIWRYQGSPTAGIVPQSEVNYHKNTLSQINSYYDSWVRYYASLQSEYIVNGGDISLWFYYQRWINTYNSERKQALDSENSRYAAVVARYTDRTQFVLSTYISVTENKTVAHCTGPNGGYTTFEAKGGMQYFTVISSGPWNITVKVSQ